MPIPLLVIGVHQKSEGYPNTLFRIRDMEESHLFQLTEINTPMLTKSKRSQHRVFHKVNLILHGLHAHFKLIAKLILLKHRGNAYIPYPATFLLLLLSIFPKKYRPRLIVADTFISLFDTVVLDRTLMREDALTSRLLKWVERRACHCADILVSDTEESKKFLCDTFELSASKVVVIPLSTDEKNFKFSPYTARTDYCRVLFIGTLVPLHGIATILEAVHIASSRAAIKFKLVGDGQDAQVVEHWQKEHGSFFEWERIWQTSSELAEAISEADICLGIFGGGDKTQRVCPFKIYAYAAVGRPIISGDTKWLVRTRGLFGKEIIAGVPAGESLALANKIVELAATPEMRVRLAEESAYFYKMQLTNRRATKMLHEIFRVP